MQLRERIHAVLALDPDAEALEYAGRWHSWGELARIGREVDEQLTRAGLGPGAAVGLLLRNRPEMVAALIGVLGSGRCAVTVDPHQGEAALGRDLEALRVPALIGSDEPISSADAAAATGAVGLAVAVGTPTRRSSPNATPQGRHHRDLPGIAVQMLTSGTTGAPKRVELSEAALSRSLVGAKHYERGGGGAPRLRAGIAVLSAPLVHVSGIFRALQCIADGRRFALLDRFEVAAWLDCVRRHRPRTASLVPAALRMLLESEIDPGDLSSLQAVVSGTAPLPPEDALAFEQRFGVPVLATYGATEFAGGVAGWNWKDHLAFGARKRGSVGRAHPGCELRVVDPESEQPVQSGALGLLEVRSRQIGDGTEWVRTTDLARLDDDGFLWIAGRADAAILRGGFKIHPDDVRSALEEHPAVREAAVVGIDDARLGQVPVAAVELVAGASADEESLRAFARERLTGHQAPVRIAIVAALPRTPALKVSQPAVRALFADPPAP